MNDILISNGKITRGGKKITSIFRILSNGVEFHEDLTVAGFLKALEPFRDEVNAAFTSHLGGSNFQDYLDEAKKKYVKSDFEDNIDFAVVDWAVDYIKTKKKKDEAFYVWANFHGKKKRSLITYGFDFSPINTYKNKPLILDKTYEIWDTSGDSRTLLFKSRKDFTFFEAVGSILCDMSFYGPPKIRDEEQDRIFGKSDDKPKKKKK
jgi:hypothetical protein